MSKEQAGTLVIPRQFYFLPVPNPEPGADHFSVAITDTPRCGDIWDCFFSTYMHTQLSVTVTSNLKTLPGSALAHSGTCVCIVAERCLMIRVSLSLLYR